MSTETMPTQWKFFPRSLERNDRKKQRLRRVAGASPTWYFAFFFISGFCSILYELIWLRLAMAQFGVTTAMVSIVLSTFMAGLGIGSWVAGHLVRKYAQTSHFPALASVRNGRVMESAVSAVVVPLELLAGRFVLEHVGNSFVPLVIGLLRCRRGLAGMQSDSVVRVHGRYHSPGHVCHP